VFSVIFTSFAVPERDRYHVLFYGVIGAIVFRAIFVLAGTALLSAFSWLVLVFGAFLIFTGFRMFRRDGGEGEIDYRNNRVLRLLRRLMPITEEYHGDNFFVRQAGRRCATPLLAALVVVEASDILFAIDSVPAVLSITQTAFVAYSSVVFAVLGLRALYFALEGLVDRFIYLHYGLAVILIFVGAKFVAQGFGAQIPVGASLLVIAVAIAASIAVSLGATRGGKPG
jgi:tellurite resistance protein TerC